MSVRFDAVLGEDERALVARAVASSGARAASWADAAGRSFALLEVGEGDAALPVAGQVHEPPLALLRIRTASAATLERLAHALCGPGRPVGVCDGIRTGDALEVSIDVAQTPWWFVLALIDEIAGRARTIEPLLPLDDAALATIASERLAEPDLDASRVLEAYL